MQPKQPTIISILGRPLAGKDTQAEMLLHALPFAVHLSTGDMIREVKRVGPEHRFWPILGPHIATMDQGILIPEEAINEVFEKVVHEKLAQGVKTIIVTAHPRMEKELTAYDDVVKKEGLQPIFININTSEDHMYVLHQTRDDSRTDDQIGVIATRIQEFNKHTQPVLDQLRKEGRLIDVDGVGTKAEVHERMKVALRPYLRDPEITLPMMARR